MNRCTLKPFRSMLLLLSLLGFAACAASLPNYAAIVANPDRPANERALDAARKPSEVLAFYGVKSGDKVADISAGRGYYTAILSEIVGAQGTVYTVNSISRDEINQRWQAPKFTNVRVADGAFDKLASLPDGSLDFVIIHLNYHDLTPEVRGPMNRRVLAVLKRGGTYGVVDHSAKEGSGNEATKTFHRIDRLLVIKEATGAGFTLAKEGSMLRNPEDTRVTNQRERSDRFVLKFEKP